MRRADADVDGRCESSGRMLPQCRRYSFSLWGTCWRRDLIILFSSPLALGWLKFSGWWSLMFIILKSSPVPLDDKWNRPNFLLMCPTLTAGSYVGGRIDCEQSAGSVTQPADTCQ